MKNIIKAVFIFSLLGVLSPAFGGGGDDHSHGDKKETAATGKSYFSAEASSGKYEMLIRYGEIIPKKDTHFDLFVSNYLTNIPADSLQLIITSPQLKNHKFEVERIDKGRYLISTKFPEERPYTLNIQVNGPWGADLIAIGGIEVGKKLLVDKESKGTSFKWGYIIIGILCFAFGVLVALLWKKKKNSRLVSILTICLTILPASFSDSAFAHGDDPHEENKQDNMSSSVNVPKETQFLFGITTRQVKAGDFTEGIQLFGTIVPSSGGQAIIASPLSGRITSLSVAVGQKIQKGQALLSIEQTLDTQTQINLLAQKNTLKSEYEAAKKEYDRLKSIADIVAKRDIDEATARMETSKYNLALLNSSTGRVLTFRSPIKGVVGNFNLSIGSIVNSNEILLTVYNLQKVYVEAQVYDKDVKSVYEGSKFMVECADDRHEAVEVRLLSPAQTINPTNQSQRVLFEMANQDEDFKIGEFVYVKTFQKESIRGLALPNSSITEINGKPAVFVKNSAEEFELRYVQLGNDNGRSTMILNGIKEGERIVDQGTYQLKMIYMN